MGDDEPRPVFRITEWLAFLQVVCWDAKRVERRYNTLPTQNILAIPQALASIDDRS